MPQILTERLIYLKEQWPLYVEHEIEQIFTLKTIVKWNETFFGECVTKRLVQENKRESEENK